MYVEKEESPGLPVVTKLIMLTGGLLLSFLIAKLLITTATVTGDSMNPGLKEGDTVYFLKPGSPARGEVVLMRSPVEPGKVLVKRVLAVGGDTVEIRDKVIYVNRKRARFTWNTRQRDSRIFPMNFSNRDILPMVKLKRSELFVIGDNLDYSYDSRIFGPVDEDLVLGRLLWVM